MQSVAIVSTVHVALKKATLFRKSAFMNRGATVVVFVSLLLVQSLLIVACTATSAPDVPSHTIDQQQTLTLPTIGPTNADHVTELEVLDILDPNAGRVMYTAFSPDGTTLAILGLN